MRVPGKTNREEGLLSLDFLIGFSIFLIGLIFVGIMISGLLVHLQSRTIDYDAVAYRTAVVLFEDPGEPSWEPYEYDMPVFRPPNWHLLNISSVDPFTKSFNRDQIKRLGLAVSKNSPGIIQYSKVEKFFDSDSSSTCLMSNKLCYPDDYREKLIFGDYPYRFNIRLKIPDLNKEYMLGDSPPESAGYIRRIGKIKQPSSLTINDPGILNNTTIIFDFSEYYVQDALHRIDPINDETVINFIFSQPTQIVTTKVCVLQMYPTESEPTCVFPTTQSPTIKIGYEGNTAKAIIESGYFNDINVNEFSEVNVTFTFDNPAINQSFYRYSTSSDIPVTVPDLTPVVMEVRVW